MLPYLLICSMKSTCYFCFTLREGLNAFEPCGHRPNQESYNVLGGNIDRL